jgi:hypothetical protein
MSLPPPEVDVHPPSNHPLAVIEPANQARPPTVSIPVTQEINETEETPNDRTTTSTSTTSKQATYVNVSTRSTIDFGVIVHHEDDESFVLSQYCLPVSTGIIQKPRLCKFGDRECVIHKSQVLQKGKAVMAISDTVYSPSVQLYSKYNYNIMDTRMVKCFNPNCIDKATNRDKVFHYVCFMHSLKKVDNRQMKLLQLESKDDSLMGYVRSEDDNASHLVEELLKTKKKIVLPVCGKRCFNWVERYRTTVIKESKMNGSSNPNWDRDGIEGVTESSSRVLINWLTTEGNLVKYLGGSDKDGRTSSSRKETYHNLIATLIKKENSKYSTK